MACVVRLSADWVSAGIMKWLMKRMGEYIMKHCPAKDVRTLACGSLAALPGQSRPHTAAWPLACTLSLSLSPAVLRS